MNKKLMFITFLGFCLLFIVLFSMSASAAKGYSFVDISQPTNCTGTAVAGGTLSASTTYYYRIIPVKYVGTLTGSNYYWQGKGKASAEFSATTTTTNKSIQIQFNMPVGEAGSYRIFRMTSSGQHNTSVVEPLKYSPDDATFNVAGTVTFIDTGYVTYGNQYIETKNDAHGILTLSGSTSSDKFCIEDLYQADLTNGWGVIDKMGPHTYRVNCYLVGHTGLYWYDEDVSIAFTDGISPGSSSNYQFGKISGELTDRGGNLRFENTWLCSITFPTLNAYRSTFTFSYHISYGGIGLTYIRFNAGLIQDCHVVKLRYFQPNSLANCKLKNVIMSGYDVGFGAGKAVFENVRALSGSRLYQLVGSQSTRGKGLYCVGSVVFAINANGYLELVDSQYGSFMSTGDCTGFELRDKISYNVNVVDDNGNPLNNATVKMYDKNDNLLFSENTNIDGDIDEQEITRELTTMVVQVRTIDSKSPFKIVVSKTNYSTYEEYVSYDTSVGVVKTVALENRTWDYSQPLTWKVLNITDTTILKLSSDGNLAIAGELYEFTNSPPPGDTVAFQINDSLWLTKTGDLYVEGEVTQESKIITFNTIATISGLITIAILYIKKKEGTNK